MQLPPKNWSDGYALNVGIALFNRDGKVFLGYRSDNKGWQMPQGGIDPGETVEQAAYRELWEETGLTADKVKMLAISPEAAIYSFPNDAIVNGHNGKRQYWVAFRFIGQDSDFNLNCHETLEFSHWRWDTLQNAVHEIVNFKRPAYRRVVAWFRPFAQ